MNIDPVRLAGAVLAIVILFTASGLYIGCDRREAVTVRGNSPGYVSADAARAHVESFYQQYIDPKKEDPEGSRAAYVRSYGDRGLVFYSQYYRHGFDPIVCSSAMPTRVTATKIEPGWGARVVARAEYPDGHTADIAVTLAINIEGFKIDSITCPGSLGDLPPLSSPRPGDI